MSAPAAERFVGTAQWHRSMSASKAAVVMGYGNPRYSSPKSLALAMIDPAKHARDETAVQARGTELEAAYINLWYRTQAGKYGIERASEGEVSYTAEVAGFPFVATPDGEATRPQTGTYLSADDTRIGIECKTCNGRGDEYSQWGEPGSDIIPMRYLVQTMFQMAISGTRRTAVIKAGPYIDDLHTYWVDYHEPLATRILRRCVEFMECVELGLLPPNDGTAATFEAVRRHNTEILRDQPGEDWPVSLDLAVEYTEALADYERAESRLNLAKSDLFEVMGKARRAIVERPAEIGRNGKPKKARPIVIASRQVAGKGVTLVKPRTPVDLDELRSLRTTQAVATAGA